MNEYFSSLASNLTGKENKESDFANILNNLPPDNNSLTINKVNYHKVQQILTSLKNDCSSHDEIPVRYIKPVTEYVVSPIVHIINTCIEKKNNFRNCGKSHTSVQFRKLMHLPQLVTIGQYQSFLFYQKFTRELS